MDEKRLIRYALPGGALLSSTVWHYRLLGGEWEGLAIGSGGESIAEGLGILAAVLSSPFFGFLCYLLSSTYFQLVRGHRQHFLVPDQFERELADDWFETLLRGSNAPSHQETLTRLRKQVPGSKDMRYELSSDEVRELYPIANSVFWNRVEPAVADMVIRGWNHYWVGVNAMTGFVVGAAIAVLLQLKDLRQSWGDYQFDGYAFFAEAVVLALALVISLCWLGSIRRDALRMANTALSEACWRDKCTHKNPVGGQDPPTSSE